MSVKLALMRVTNGGYEMNRDYTLWRLIKGHWNKIKAVCYANYPCCATYERVLLRGVRPSANHY